jgi:hypothetical protein
MAYEVQGQVRNNKIEVDKANACGLLRNDAVFANFKETGLTTAAYESKLLQKAKQKGIDTVKLQKAIASAKLLKKGNFVNLVIVETAKIDGKDGFLLKFGWEMPINGFNPKTVGPLGHYLITAVDANSYKVIASESCR